MKKDVDMLNGSIIKGLFAIALPIMVMNVVQSLFNIVDMTVLKNFSGDESSAARTVGTAVLFALTGGAKREKSEIIANRRWFRISFVIR